jgi:phosphoribosylformylglycinamidine (FGAM) synthase-like enzyme
MCSMPPLTNVFSRLALRKGNTFIFIGMSAARKGITSGGLVSVKRDLVSVKRDLVSVKRDLVSVKRDLVSVKRDLVSGA